MSIEDLSFNDTIEEDLTLVVRSSHALQFRHQRTQIEPFMLWIKPANHKLQVML